MPVITLRFVASDSAISRMIRFQAGLCMPFTPSHVEALARDGAHYTGAHIDGGIEARPIGYDAADPNVREAIVPIPVGQSAYDAFHAYVESKIGEPYDWKAILSFADPAQNLHETGHVICSAFMALALRAAGVFPFPLAVPAHHISPRDVLLMVSSRVEVAH